MKWASHKIEIDAEDLEELEQKIRAAFPNRALEFEGYTDQLDVFVRRANGKRRDRFMTFMPGELFEPY